MASKALNDFDPFEDDEEGIEKVKKDGLTIIDHHNNCYLSSLILIFLAPGFGGFMFGYDIGASAYAISAFSEEGYWKEDKGWRIRLFASITTIAAFIGSFIMFPIADRIGRRKEMIYGSMLYIVGALWQAFPSIYIYLFTSSKFVMSDIIFWYGFVLGRFIYGLGIGITMHGAPAYLGEMIPSTIRGKLLSLLEIFILLGMLAGYIFGYLLEVDEEKIKKEEFTMNNDIWAYAYVYSLSVSLTMFAILKFCVPYSYRWLLLRGRSDEALESLRFLYKPGYAEEQHQILIKSTSFGLNDSNNSQDVNNDKEYQHQQRSQNNMDDSKVYSSILNPSFRSSLITGLGLMILQQTTSLSLVLEHVAVLFNAWGISTLSSVSVAIFQILASSMAFIFVEKYGRRNLLFLGVTMMLIGCVVLVVFTAFTYNNDSSPRTVISTMMMISKEEEENEYDTEFYGAVFAKDEHMKLFTLIALCVYICGYQISFGPITWLTISEVFPIPIRAQALSIAIQLKFLLNAGIDFAVAPILQNSLGSSNTFVIFAIFAIILVYALYFIDHYVLETKGLTLEEIEEEYNNRNNNQESKEITAHNMSPLFPFIDQIQSTVRSNDNKTFATWYDEKGKAVDEYSFSELWLEAGVIAYHLRMKWNLNKGDRVVLCYGFGLQFFASFLGCIRAGVTAVLVYPPAPPLTKSLPKMTKVANDCNAKLILIDLKIQMLKKLDKANFMSKTGNLWPVTDYKVHSFQKGGGRKNRNKGVMISFDDPTIIASDLAFLQYTSGSTGNPKGVMVTYGALNANIRAIIKEFYQAHNININASAEYLYSNIGLFSWLPQYHDMGLIEALLAPFAGGCRCHMMSPLSFIKNPLLWIDLMSRLQVTCSLAPDFAYRLAARKFKEAQNRGIIEPIPNLNLSSIVALQSAAEPVRTDTVNVFFNEIFSNYGLKKESLVIAYGLAESVVLASAFHGKKIYNGINGSKIYAVGHRSSFPQGQTTKVVEPETCKEVEDGTIGELWLSGPSITAGYFGKPKLTEDVYHAKIDGMLDCPNFLRTGDLAFFEDDYLYICGRQKDLIIVNGVNYYPQDVEFAVQDASPLVRPGCVAAFSSDDTGNGTSDLEILFEIRNRASYQEVQDVVDAVKTYVSSVIGIVPSRVVAIRERSILKTTSGKIQRQANRAALHEGKYSIKYEYVRKSITVNSIRSSTEEEDQVDDITKTKKPDAFDQTVASFFGKNFDSDLSWEEMGLSSMASVQLRDSIYDLYCISLPPDCFELYTTPRCLKEYIVGNQGIPVKQILPPLATLNSQEIPGIVTAFIQAMGSIVLLFIFSLPIVPSWYVGKYMASNFVVNIQSLGAKEMDIPLVWIPIVVPTWMVSFTVLTVMLKWVVVGKYREGIMPLTSFAYLRWWFMDRNIALWEFLIGRIIINTPLLNLVYFSMGAKIHQSATIDAFVREFDLVEVGENASVEHQVRCRKFKLCKDCHDAFFVNFRSITIHGNSTVKGMLLPGCTIFENATIEKLSVVPEGGQVSANTTAFGNPAYLIRDGEQVTPGRLRHSWLVLGMLKLLWLAFELYLFFAIMFLGQYLWMANLPANWHYTPLLSCFLLFVWFSLVSIFTSVIIKWVLIGKRRSGPYRDTVLREFADWAADWHFAISTDLVYHTCNSRIWNIILMMHGMDIDFKSKIDGCDYIPSKLDLVRVRKSFISSNFSFNVNKDNIYHAIDVKNASIGHSCHLEKGAKISNKIIPTQSLVSTSIVEDQQNDKFPKYLTTLNVLASECVSLLNFLLLLLVIFGHLIPSYDLWTIVFQVDSIWMAFFALPAALLIQTLVSFVVLAVTQHITLVGSSKSNAPWNNEVYMVYQELAFCFQKWSLAAIVMHGSPIYNVLLSILGVKFKGRALIFETGMYEYKITTLEHMTIVDQSPGIVGHYAVYDKITIGPCKVSGIIHPGTFVANATLTSEESGPWRTFVGTIEDTSETLLNETV